MTQFQIHATTTFFFYRYCEKPRTRLPVKGAAWRGACTNSKREGLNEVRPGFRQPRIFPTRINGARRGGVPSLQQQPRPPPTNALPSKISGVQRRKGANLLASAKASVTTRRNNQKDLPRDCKADRCTYGAGPRVWEPGLPSPDAHTPLALQLCSQEHLGSAWVSPIPLLHSGAICRGEVRKGGPYCSPCPCALLQPVRTPVNSPDAEDSPPTSHTPLPVGARNPLPTLRLWRHP